MADQPEKKLPPPVPENKIDGSMKTEEPLGWDQAPLDIKKPEEKRHSRIDGSGGIGKPFSQD